MRLRLRRLPQPAGAARPRARDPRAERSALRRAPRGARRGRGGGSGRAARDRGDPRSGAAAALHPSDRPDGDLHGAHHRRACARAPRCGPAARRPPGSGGVGRRASARQRPGRRRLGRRAARRRRARGRPQRRARVGGRLSSPRDRGAAGAGRPARVAARARNSRGKRRARRLARAPAGRRRHARRTQRRRRGPRSFSQARSIAISDSPTRSRSSIALQPRSTRAPPSSVEARGRGRRDRDERPCHRAVDGVPRRRAARVGRDRSRGSGGAARRCVLRFDSDERARCGRCPPRDARARGSRRADVRVGACSRARHCRCSGPSGMRR